MFDNVYFVLEEMEIYFKIPTGIQNIKRLI